MNKINKEINPIRVYLMNSIELIGMLQKNTGCKKDKKFAKKRLNIIIDRLNCDLSNHESFEDLWIEYADYRLFIEKNQYTKALTAGKGLLDKFRRYEYKSGAII
jgi:hypothetical protein